MVKSPILIRVLLVLVACVAPLSAAGKPNIVLFVTDDQSPIAGCYGSPVIQTPHLDALAKDGTLFTNAYATTASCSASRSVILTGTHNHANGQYGHVHDYHHFETYANCAAISLPLQLKLLGYRTAHIGKNHVAPDAVYHYDRELKTTGAHDSPNWVKNCEPLFNEKADQPFYLAFWTHDPHRSGEEQESVPGDLKPNAFGNPQVGKQYPGIEEVVYDPAKVVVPSWLPDTPECRAEIAQYYQSVARTDKALGALVMALKQAGQYDNTIILFTADHGMAFPGAKTTVYEAGLRVPFVIHLPGAKPGVVNDAMISHLDLTPTLVDAAGGLDRATNGPKQLAPVEKVGTGENPGKKFTRYQGRSWLGLVGQEHGEGWDEISASHTFHEIQMYYPMRAIRDRHYKLIWNIASPLPFPFASDLWAASTWQGAWRQGPQALYGNRTVDSYIHRPPFELYDMEQDPAETKNLATDPAHKDLLEAMKQRLKDMQKRTDDPWRLKWEYE
ncbi:sulfatase [Luteolibacter sp. LG18]|uniref:sulfatase family protein n=1 Tax=Luteolibacter sp. LG18 TaxID=2819286 RepID=UPI002B2E986F|nr:heparan N-sulfatase [Luteolibacter sp. LG18]